MKEERRHILFEIDYSYNSSYFMYLLCSYNFKSGILNQCGEDGLLNAFVFG